MLNRNLAIASLAAMLTTMPSLAQPQTTDPNSTSATGTTATGTQGMNGTFRGSPSDSGTTTGTATGTTTGTTDTSTSGTSNTTSGYGSTTGTSSSTSGYGSTSSTATTDQDAATAGATAGATTAGSNRLQGQDATFLQKAMESDRLEIASAQQALDNAQRSDTRTAAQMLLDDHQKSSEQLQQLASRKGWSVPATTASAESDQARMTSTSGSGSFDDRYMADQIRAHREAISLYRAEASSGSDPELRQFARDQLPHLEHHLEMLQGSNTQK
jgi:putative membrane protein